jgi:hypothetical protein
VIATVTPTPIVARPPVSVGRAANLTAEVELAAIAVENNVTICPTTPTSRASATFAGSTR